MANAEHVDILEQGIEVWNQWRKEKPEIVPNLREADLHFADLSAANFREADLSAAYLYLAGLREADLYFADLSGANLHLADLRKANLNAATLSKTNLSESEFSNADLREADLSEADLRKATLNRANLRGATLSAANLSEANLSEANLYKATLNRANLYKANLRKAHLSEADLSGVDLRKSHLTGAILRCAILHEANLREADFSGTDWTETICGYTTFGNVDLSQVKGLEMVKHYGPSYIDIQTIYRSGGNIPEVFLRGAGVPDNFITFMKSLTSQAFDLYSCFISHSSKDKEFVERLYADLQSNGVRCWYAPEDLKIGEPFLLGIDQGIRLHDKLLLVLSENSVSSGWVQHEVLSAMAKEQGKAPWVLFPIRLDTAVMETNVPWANMIRQSRHIGDFTQWKDHDSYRKAVDRLLRDLKGKS